MKKKNIFLCGDIHGDLKELSWTLTEKLGLQDISCIVLGDFGTGFGGPNSTNVLYDSVKGKLEKNNIRLYAIRGNHDDPSYFDGQHNYPRLVFLKDHTLVNIDGWDIYPIGGAQSTDMDERLKENAKNESRGNNRRVWWPDERPNMDIHKFPGRAEVIISHTAPISFDPVVTRQSEMSSTIYNNIVEERTYLSEPLTEIRADYWFYGHFHDHFSGTYGNLIYRGLGIKELFELRCQED